MHLNYIVINRVKNTNHNCTLVELLLYFSSLYYTQIIVGLSFFSLLVIPLSKSMDRKILYLCQNFGVKFLTKGKSRFSMHKS